MYKHNDLTGKVFGRLTVIEEAGRAKDRSYGERKDGEG